MTIRLKESDKIKVINSADVYLIMQRILLRENKIDRGKEHFWIVCLAPGNQILMIELVSLGTSSQTLVEPMQVFSFALQKQASKIILVHNHPAGGIKPSLEDEQQTEKMLAIGKFLNVPVCDHLIITTSNYYSFKDSGKLDELGHNSRYDLTFGNAKALKTEAKNVGKEAAKKIAKKALAEGMSVVQVSKISGLTKKQVETLNLHLKKSK